VYLVAYCMPSYANDVVKLWCHLAYRHV